PEVAVGQKRKVGRVEHAEQRRTQMDVEANLRAQGDPEMARAVSRLTARAVLQQNAPAKVRIEDRVATETVAEKRPEAPGHELFSVIAGVVARGARHAEVLGVKPHGESVVEGELGFDEEQAA